MQSGTRTQIAHITSAAPNLQSAEHPGFSNGGGTLAKGMMPSLEAEVSPEKELFKVISSK